MIRHFWLPLPTSLPPPALTLTNHGLAKRCAFVAFTPSPDTAAGYTTCGRRAGTLYHEYDDAAKFKAWGVDYLKYDDCGEPNIQS